ncbi:MAG: hypothetical protein ACLQLC_06925 [Candidatus Sulfotelmatobacter sp.]
MAEVKTGKSLETVMQELLDAETVADIVAQFEFSSTGKHLSEEHNATADALLQELQKRLAVITDPDERLTIAREARAAWHKVIRGALNVASDGPPVSHSLVLEQDAR